MDISVPPTDESSAGATLNDRPTFADTCLDPSVLQRLIEFRARRLRLAMYRGCSLTVTVFLAALLVAICLEGMLNHPSVRWLGSGLTYGCPLFVFLWLVLKPLIASRSILDDARRLEALDPQLKNFLLSAVELSQDSPTNQRFSPAFRSELQRQVAACLEPVDMLQLLPWHRIKWSLRLAAGTLLLTCLLFCIPWLHLPLRAARVLAPTANLGRVSSVAIKVYKPLPTSQHIPRGEVLAIVAGIEGKLSDDVWLEWSSDETLHRTPLAQLNSYRAKQLVTATGQARSNSLFFETTLTVDVAAIKYRITSADASTAWHHIQTSPRPYAESFEFTVWTPKYAEERSERKLQDHGDINCLTGSLVQIAIDANQELSIAKLQWLGNSESDDNQEMQLNWDPKRKRHIAQFKARRDQTYRLVLRSAQTGFVNEFSQSYQIRCIDDAPPTVRWKNPAPSSITSSSSSVLPLSVAITDELPLRDINLLICPDSSAAWLPTEADVSLRDNRLDAKASETASFVEELETEANWALDLQSFDLEAGSTLKLKVGVTDAKQQYSESEVRTVLISAITLDLQPNLAEMLRKQIAVELSSLASKASHHPTNSSAEAKASAQQLVLKERSKNLERGLLAILPRIIHAAESCEDPVDRQELIQLGNWINQRFIADALPADGNISQQLESAAQQWLALVTFDHASRIAVAMTKLASSFEALANDPQSSTEHLRRQFKVDKKLLEKIQASMLSNTDTIHPQSVARLRGNATRLGEIINQIDRLLPNSSHDGLKRLAEQLSEKLDTMRLLARLDDGLMSNLQEGHRFFNESVGGTGSIVSGFAKRHSTPNSVELHLSNESRSEAKTKLISFLAHRRRLHRAATAGTPHLASMLGYARRAVQRTLQADFGEQTKKLNQISEALKVLELADELKISANTLDALLEIERWETSPVRRTTEGPRMWDSTVERLDAALRLTETLKLPEELRHEMRNLRGDTVARQVDAALESRLWTAKEVLPQTANLETKRGQVRSLREQFAPFVRRAQQTLMDAAPDLLELAQESADRAKTLELETGDLRGKLRRKDWGTKEPLSDQDVVSNAIDSLEDAATRARLPLHDLRETLVDLADTRELLQQDHIRQAKLADGAIGLVDQSKHELVNSLEIVSQVVEEMLNGDQPSPRQSIEASEQDGLAQASSLQAQAASRLQEFADRLHAIDASEQDHELERVLSQWFELEPTLQNQTESQLSETPNEHKNAFARAEKLAQLARAQPRELMQALEAELASNQAMRTELSAMARRIAADALLELRVASKKQSPLAPGIEDSDPDVDAEKELLQHDLQFVQALAANDLSMLIGEVCWTAGSGREGEITKQLKAVEVGLQTVLEKNRSRDPMHQTRQTLRQHVRDIARQLRLVAESMDEAQVELSNSSQRGIHPTQGELINRRRELRDRSRRIHQQDLRHWERAARSDQQALDSAEQALRRAKEKLAAAQRELQNQPPLIEQNPASQKASIQVPEDEAKLELMQRSVTSVSNQVSALQQRLERTEEFVRRARKTTEPDLNVGNPSAKLSSFLAKQTQVRSRWLHQRLLEWDDQVTDEVQASAAALDEAAQIEEAIQSEVRQAADTLSRATRHEARLGNVKASNQLNQQQTKIRQTADEALAKAVRLMQAAQPQIKPSVLQHSINSKESAARAIQAAENASRDLREQVKELNRFLSVNKSPQQQLEQAKGDTSNSARASASENDSQADSGTAASPTGPAANPSNPLPELSELELDSTELAQLLDAVDRQLHPSNSLAQTKAGSPSSQANPNEMVQSPTTLTQLANQLAQRLSQSRETSSQASQKGAGRPSESRQASISPRSDVVSLGFDVADVEQLQASQDWAELRDRRDQAASASASERMLPRYREQVDAYFRNLNIIPSEDKGS